MEKKKFDNVESEPYLGKETHIVFVVDESGSMGCLRQKVIELFNEQIAIIKEKEKHPKSTVSLITFSDSKRIRRRFDFRKVKDLKNITTEDYVPEGMTALIDAVLSAIDLIGEKKPQLLLSASQNEKKAVKTEKIAVLILVLTDGQENASVRDPSALKEYTESLEKTGYWTITYLINEVGKKSMRTFLSSVGTQSGNIATFAATGQGIGVGSDMMRSSLSGYYDARADGKTQISSFYDDKTEDVDTINKPDEP